MTYSNIINQLYNVNLHGGVKLGLSNCLALNKALGNPDKMFNSIHVAGTNGKGSVTTKIAKALEYQGFKIGLYTSPHVATFRERITINGEMISENDVLDHLQKIFNLSDQLDLHPTFFELTTLLALDYFAQQKIDIAVLETGLGGRLDATNIVSPLLTIITSISLEHTETLGTTIEQIAKEKGGIIKPKVPILIGPKVPREVIDEIANHKESPLYTIQGDFLNFDEENQAIAKKALELLDIPANIIEKAIKVLPSCRLEIWKPIDFKSIDHFPEALVLDVGHNPDGLDHLFKALEQRFPLKQKHILFGLSKSKDIVGCLEIIKKHGCSFTPVEALNQRGVPVKDLEQIMLKQGFLPSTIYREDTIEKSFRRALQLSHGGSKILVVCGTFFIMGAIRRLLGLQEAHDSLDMNEISR